MLHEYEMFQRKDQKKIVENSRGGVAISTADFSLKNKKHFKFAINIEDTLSEKLWLAFYKFA